MPVRVNKNGNSYYLVPAPLVTYEKRFTRLGNGQLISNGYSISLNGKILPNKGNPIASGNIGTLSTDGWTSSISPDDDPNGNNFESDVLSATIAKQAKIQELFESGTAIDVAIFGYGQSSGINFYANVESVSFPEDGRWALPSTYNINLITNKIDGQEDFEYHINEVSESWSIQEDDQVKVNFGSTLDSVNKIYKISHNLSSVGLPVYNSSGGYLNNIAPWQQASGYVMNTLGLGNSKIPSGNLVPIFAGYAIANRTLEESIDKLAGSYAITENYIAYRTGISPFPAIEELSISVEDTEEGIDNIQIQGTIKGLDTNQNIAISGTVNKFYNASGYYNDVQSLLYNRILAISNLDWVHPIYLNSSVAYSINDGVITYSRRYDNRPPNLVSGSRVENISVQNTYPGQNFSSQNVIGRDQAVLQYLNSRTNYTRTLNIDITMSRLANNWGTGTNNGYWLSASSANISNWFLNQAPNVTQTEAFNKIYEALNPANESGVIPHKVFHNSPQDDWNPRSNKYTYSITWTYEKN